jgi:short-subunit dehydrogenase
MNDFAQRYGPWAVVAGGSEGLGLAFVRGLLEREVKVLVVSHDQESLDAAMPALKEFGEAEAVLGDLRTDGVERTLAACQGKDIGLLVANAAVAPRGAFLDADPDELIAAIRVNVEAPVRLARALGPAMRTRGRGGIVLVSSLSSLNGTPMFSTYAGTKAFLRVQAEGLWDELRDHGVDVLAVVPGTMDTPGFRSSSAKGGPAPISPEKVSSRTLEHLGEGPVLFPVLRDRISALALTRLLGRRQAIRITGRMTRKMYE